MGTGGRGPSGLRDPLLYLTAAVAQRGTPVLALPILSRLTDARGLGEVATALAVANVLAIVMGFGLNSAILRLYFDDDSASPSTAWAALMRLQLLGAIFVVVVAMVTGPMWADFIFSELGWTSSLVLAIFLAFAMARTSVTLAVTRSAGRAAEYLSLTVVSGFAGVSVGLLLTPVMGVAGYLTGMLAGNTAVAVAGAIRHSTPALWRWARIGQGTRYSLVLLAHMVAGWIFTMSDRVLVERYLNLELVGQYFIAYAIGTSIYLIFDSVQAVWLSSFYASSRAEKESFVVGAAGWLAGIGASGALMTALMAPFVLALFSPTVLRSSLVALTVVSIGAIARPVYLVCYAALADVKRSRPLAASSFLAAGVSLGMNVVMIPAFGIVGAALTYAFVSTLQAVLVVWVTRRHWELQRLSPAIVVWSSGVALTVSTLWIPAETVGTIVRISATVVVTILATWVTLRLRDSGRVGLRREANQARPI